ncbi:MAG: ATP-binding protein [Bradymonadaceae bacterium]
MKELFENNPLRAPGEVLRLNLAWIIRLRWVAIIGQTGVILAAHSVFDLDFPYSILFFILIIETLSNGALVLWARRLPRPRESLVGFVLVFDIFFLTSLLYWTGGSFNPFSLLYFIHIALAALVLRSIWTWVVTLLCILGYGALFFIYSQHDLDWVLRPQLWDIETQGRWAAFAVTAGVLAFFINRIQLALTRRDSEIIRIRDSQIRSERLAALATLAAGAAHEFSTPLATIAVVAGELERGLERADAEPTLVEDTRLIRAEVERCRHILQQMSAGAGESPGELATTVCIGTLVDVTLDGLSRAHRVDFIVDATPTFAMRVPLTALGQALRGLLNNALDASAPEQTVELVIGAEQDTLCLEIRDQGRGISPELLDRVGEPFFTTKSPGQGMGLGVYLARSLVETIGGELEMSSTVGSGTTVRVRIPNACVIRSGGLEQVLSSELSPETSPPEAAYDGHS